MAIAERIGRVDADNVDVAFRSPVLKSIVKNESRCPKFISRKLRRCYPVRVGDDNCLAEKFICELDGLIAADAGIREDFLSIRNDDSAARRPSVSAREYAHLLTVVPKQLGD
jgi:hypothetical protein